MNKTIKTYSPADGGASFAYSFHRSIQIFASVALIVCLVCTPAHADDFESEQLTLSASRLLGANALKGEHYRINEKVTNKGFMNHYSVSSDFGKFDAGSD
ncbi:MAG: hypothetical protein ACR2QW_03420, partial [bacterium]